MSITERDQNRDLAPFFADFLSAIVRRLRQLFLAHLLRVTILFLELVQLGLLLGEFARLGVVQFLGDALVRQGGPAPVGAAVGAAVGVVMGLGLARRLQDDVELLSLLAFRHD